MSQPSKAPPFRQSDSYRHRIKHSVRLYQAYRWTVHKDSVITAEQLNALHYFLDTHIPDDDRKAHSQPRPEGKRRDEAPRVVPRDMLSALGV